MNMPDTRQLARDDDAHAWVGMNRADDLHVTARSQPRKCPADPRHRMPLDLAPVKRDQDQAPGRVEPAETGPHRCPRGRGCKMRSGQDSGHAPVHLLGPRRCRIAGAQPGFDMADRHARVEGGKAGGERRGGVAVDQHAVRALVGEDLFEPGQDRGRHVGQTLSAAHDVEVGIRGETKDGQGLIEHKAPLLCWMLDMEIQTATDGRKHLTDLLKILYQEHGNMNQEL